MTTRTLSLLLLGLSACGPTLEPLPTPASGAAEATSNRIVAEGFTPLGIKDGVTLYSRKRAAGLELAAEGDLPAPPERIERILLDYPSHRSWQSHLAECNVLARGADWLDVYERLSLPLLDDRDYTLHVSWGLDGDARWMKFKTTSENGPAPIEDVVRVATHEGGWRLEPLEGGAKTHAQYRFRLDIRSDLADSMGTGQAESDLVDLFAQITAQLPRYP